MQQSARVLALPERLSLRLPERLRGVGSIVRHRLQRAGVDAPAGAHQFRHGLATEMLRQGASLGEIGELLGHHNHSNHQDLARKVDLDALRTLAITVAGNDDHAS